MFQHVKVTNISVMYYTSHFVFYFFMILN